MNVPSGNTRSAAELTMTLIMALARNIPAAVSSLKSGKWERSKFMGSELSGKVIGVVGLGRIGREVAKWCQSFGMVAIGYDPIMAPDVAAKAGITPVALEELFARADYITLHTPKTPETTNLISKTTLAKCKTGVRIVNVARGGIVHEQDLLDALNSGKVAAAALDVFSTEPPPEAAKALLQHPNVICTPHLGASTTEAQLNVARDIAIQMADALENKAFNGNNVARPADCLEDKGFLLQLLPLIFSFSSFFPVARCRERFQPVFPFSPRAGRLHFDR
jgi:D-3-phosphoglycerate dehydrogenase / 2-oxoglutarate reductase